MKTIRRVVSAAAWPWVALAAVLALVPLVPAAAQNAPVKVIITFTSPPGLSDVAAVASAGRVDHVYGIIPGIAAEVPSTALPGLARNPRIAAIEPDLKVHKIDAELDGAWGVKRIGAGAIHAGGNAGFGVRVAVVDSGVDYTHPDLDGNFVGGYDFVDNDPDPMDCDGHGTHVAGTIAAEDNGTGVVGVAPSASIFAVRVLDCTGSGYWSDIIAGIDWCVANGIQVTNNSYGSSTNPGGAVQAAFDNAAAAGVLHVAAAGNEGNPGGKGNSVGFPARYASVIAVAATDANDKRAGFSSTGDTVEIAAPGVTINSTLLGGGYGTASGTSMASPHVAGTAALVIAAGHTDVRTRLQQTADDLGAAGKDPRYGYGLVDADEAAAPQGPINNAPAVTIQSPLDGATYASGATIDFFGSALDAEDGDLTPSLAWTSSIDGAIGTGAAFARTLSDGVHTISASATDSGGATGSATASITVGTPPPQPTLSVTVATDKASDVNKQKVNITVTVTDGASPAAGAAVSVTLTTAKGGTQGANGTTDGSGVARFVYTVNSKRDGVGTYTAEATATKAGYTAGSGSTTFQVTK